MVSFVDIGSGRVAYERCGHGPTVILSHASLVDRRMWRAQLETLADEYDVIAYDRLGYGSSSEAPARVRHEVDLVRLLDALGVGRATLIGSSMGGGYSLAAALLAPDRANGVATICAGVPGYEWPAAMRAQTRDLLVRAVPPDRLRAYATHTAEVILDEDIDAMATMQLRYLVVGPNRNLDVIEPATWKALHEMARGVFTRMWRDPASEEIVPDPPLLTTLAAITVPTLVISGEADVSHIQELSRVLGSAIPGARTVTLADTGHLPSAERPGETSALLRQFLATLSA